MSTQYLLSCTCGRKVSVDSNQAGLSIHCVCGEALDVPSLRELSRTVPTVAKPAEPTSARQSNWGPREATLLLGVVLVATGGGLAAYLLMTWPMPPDLSVPYDEIRQRVDRMSAEQTLQLWERFSGGLQLLYVAELDGYRHDRRSYREHLSLSTAIGVIGLAVICAGLVGFRKTSTKRRLPGRPTVS